MKRKEVLVILVLARALLFVLMLVLCIYNINNGRIGYSIMNGICSLIWLAMTFVGAADLVKVETE